VDGWIGRWTDELTREKANALRDRRTNECMDGLNERLEAWTDQDIRKDG
jgi:hypothetical protein